MPSKRSPKKTMAAWVSDLESQPPAPPKSPPRARREKESSRAGATSSSSVASARPSALTSPVRASRPGGFAAAEAAAAAAQTAHEEEKRARAARIEANKRDLAARTRLPRTGAPPKESAASSTHQTQSKRPSAPAAAASSPAKTTTTTTKTKTKPALPPRSPTKPSAPVATVTRHPVTRSPAKNNADGRRAPSPATIASDARAANVLWDRTARAMRTAHDALDEAAFAVLHDGPNVAAGTPGFGAGGIGGGADPKSSHAAAAAVSGATRKKIASRAAVKIKAARDELNDLFAGFNELRRHGDALADALARSEGGYADVTKQLASVAGYAEETTRALRKSAKEKTDVSSELAETKAALDQANNHVKQLTQRVELEATNARELARWKVEAAEGRKHSAAFEAMRDANARHKEAVAKLTADNMVFLTRMRESETELKTLREETAGMRGEVEDKRGVWFDRARKDVERVVQNAMKRAEDAEAALEAATGASEQRVEEWTKTLEMTRTKLEETLKENDALAMKAAEAMNAESDAAAALRQSESELRDAVDRASESAHAAKAATDAMAAAREELGVLRMEHRRAREELQLAEGTVRDNAKELNKWRAVNEGVMRSKNEMEWRMLEMQAAFERAGLSFIPGEGAGSGSGSGSTPAPALSPLPPSLHRTPEPVVVAGGGGFKRERSNPELEAAMHLRRSVVDLGDDDDDDDDGRDEAISETVTPVGLTAPSGVERAAKTASKTGTAAPLIGKATTRGGYGAANKTPAVKSPKKSAAAAVAAAAEEEEEDVLEKAKEPEKAKPGRRGRGKNVAKVVPPPQQPSKKEKKAAAAKEAAPKKQKTSRDDGSESEEPHRPYQRLHDDEAEAAGSSPGPEFPPLAADDGDGGKKKKKKYSDDATSLSPPPPSGAAKGIKSSLARAAASAAASVGRAASNASSETNDDGDLFGGGGGGARSSPSAGSADAAAEARERAWMEATMERARQAAGGGFVKRVNAAKWGGADDDLDGHAVVDERVFLEAAARTTRRRAEEATATATATAAPAAARPASVRSLASATSSEAAQSGFGWIGGHPGASAHTSVAALDGGDTSDEDRRALAEGRAPRVPYFGGSSSDDENENDDGAAMSPRGPRVDAARHVPGVGLLSSGRIGASYGAVDEGGDAGARARGGGGGGDGVRFANALPNFEGLSRDEIVARAMSNVDAAIELAEQRRREGGGDGREVTGFSWAEAVERELGGGSGSGSGGGGGGNGSGGGGQKVTFSNALPRVR